MFKRLIAVAAGLAALAAVTATQAADPIKIGFSISKTGLFAQAATSQLQTYELWREQVNARGGLNVAGVKRNIEFVFYDDQSNSAKAVQIYEKLITDDKVALLLAPWGTSLHFAIAGVIERYKFPVIGNTAASVQLRELKAGYIWFTTSSFPDKQSAVIAKSVEEPGRQIGSPGHQPASLHPGEQEIHPPRTQEGRDRASRQRGLPAQRQRLYAVAYQSEERQAGCGSRLYLPGRFGALRQRRPRSGPQHQNPGDSARPAIRFLRQDIRRGA